MSSITIKSDKSVVLIPFEQYESMRETIELLSNYPNLPKELKKIRKEIEKGKFITFDDFKKKHKIK